MPDISKINAVAIADIEKVDGILAADIEKVNGLVFSTAPAIAAPAAAYSVRLLDTAVGVPTYTGSAMRVREDSGDTETDIGFDTNGDLLTADIATHCGTANGFVVTWYDQSGNANDAEQPTAGGAALQPKIYDGTTQSVITENGKPAVDFDGVNDFLAATGAVWTRLAFAGVMYIDVPDDSVALQYGQIDSRFHVGVGGLGSANKIGSRVYDGAFFGDFGADISDGQYLVYNNASIGPDTNEMYLDGAAVSQAYGTRSGTPSTATYTIGCRGNNSFHFLGKFQELTIWTSDQTDNRTGIEENINNHFAIGNLPNPTSGLLFDYPDAAAAYSVRQLANTAPLSMRVRRDTAGGTGDDDEADVLFDFTLTDPTISLDSRINNPSAGVASTTLGEFLNATGYTDVDNLTVVADGFCDTWYDQSGNGNDAEQTAFGSQPQIFDSASPTDLIQENGKPAMSEWYDNQAILIASFGTTYNDVHVFSVTNDAGGTGVLGYVVSGNTGSNFRMARNFSGSDIWLYDGAQALSTTSEATGQALISSTNETTPTAFFNGSSRSFNNTLNGNGMSDAYIGRHPSLTSGGMRGTIQEIIIFSAHQSSTNRTGIESDMDTYFSIT